MVIRQRGQSVCWCMNAAVVVVYEDEGEIEGTTHVPTARQKWLMASRAGSIAEA